MNPHYQTVLTALRVVEAEIKAIRSNDGERLDAYADRKLRLAAARLADLLFPSKVDPKMVKFGFGRVRGLYAQLGERLFYYPERGPGGWRHVCQDFNTATKGVINLEMVERIFPDAVNALREYDTSAT